MSEPRAVLNEKKPAKVTITILEMSAEGINCKTIAEQMGMPHGSVKIRIYKSISKYRI